MMYKAEILPELERLHRVRAQLAVARTRPPDEGARALAAGRRELERLRCKVRRLRHPLLRMLPVTWSEIGVVARYGTLTFLLAVVVCIVMAAQIIFIASLHAQATRGPTGAGPSIGDVDPVQLARDLLRPPIL